MPRIVRNFFISGEVDGRKTAISVGPASKEGGFDVQFLIRSAGEVAQSVRVIGEAFEGGDLKLTVLDENGNDIHVHRTVR